MCPFLILNNYMTLYNETRRLYQQNRKDDTICQLLIHGAILPSLLVIGEHHI